jgi:hypothetical protein
MPKKVDGEFSIVVDGCSKPVLSATGKTLMQTRDNPDSYLELEAEYAVAQILECYRERISWQQLQANGYKIIRVKLVEVS